ncbi:MAG: hypothetical protein ABI609_18545 [Acidobacteriota bacterium]
MRCRLANQEERKCRDRRSDSETEDELLRDSGENDDKGALTKGELAHRPDALHADTPEKKLIKRADEQSD